jgi:acetyl-CoA acyltransferase 1
MNQGASEQLTSNPTSAGDSAAYERRAGSLDDVVIVASCRTALCRAKKGGFRDTPADDLMAAVLRDVVRRAGVEPEAIGDICFGSVLGPSSQRANELRMAAFFAGFPDTVPVHTVNRQCSSGLQAIAQVRESYRWWNLHEAAAETAMLA